MSATCCSNCEALREALREAHLMLGWSRDHDREELFARHFGLTRFRAALLARLYAAGERGLSHQALREGLADLPGRRDRAQDVDEDNIVRVQIHKTRRALGEGFIETVWGTGYRMTKAGRAACDEALALSRGAAS